MHKGLIAVGSGLGLVALLLAGCSSETESDVTPTVTPTPTETTAVVAVLAQDACADYFAFDLLRAQLNGGTSELKKKQKRALLEEMQVITDQMVVSVDSAVIGGELPAKALANAERIQNNINKADAKAGIDGLNKKQINRINSSSERIERACVAAGNELPASNITARG